MKTQINKSEIMAIRNLTVSDLINIGFSMDTLLEMGEVEHKFYDPSETFEFFDGEYFYNHKGRRLRPLASFDTRSEGYTPFGDE